MLFVSSGSINNPFGVRHVDNFINLDNLITFIVGMYFWGWILFLRDKYPTKINLLHFIIFIFCFFGWILGDADWSWLLESEAHNSE